MINGIFCFIFSDRPTIIIITMAMRDTIMKTIKCFPSIEYLESTFSKYPLELENIQYFNGVVKEYADSARLDHLLINDIFAVCDGIKDHLWEIINTGHYSLVDKCVRQLYAVIVLEKVILLLMRNEEDCGMPLKDLVEKCIWELDSGILIGYKIDHPNYQYCLNDCLTVVQQLIQSSDNANHLTQRINGDDDLKRNENCKCDIAVCDRPSIEYFQAAHFNQLPVVIQNSMDQWPAINKWCQSNYLLDKCRSRIVPIEIGQNYTNENWSQQLVKFDDFFRRQMINSESSSTTIEYLAQHNLFEQIPKLKDDIITPEYCCITADHSGCNDIDIKAWLGPEGTISPMHFDNKQNLLCQVFGTKRIILAAPSDTDNLYPHDGEMLHNTSQIDAEHLNFEQFPLTSRVKFYELTLYKGEILYIPSKWWHYVRSLSKSFSVSFWWE